MQTVNIKKCVIASALLLLISVGASVQAATLSVNCAGTSGLTSINAAIKALASFESHGPATINVAGACHENIVIQSTNRLTLNAINGASITDASSGTLDVVGVIDSRDVTIAGFLINGGAMGISCEGGSWCELDNDTVQGVPAGGGGIGVFLFSGATLSGVKLLNNDIGLWVSNGGQVRGDATIQGSNRGLHMTTGAVVNIAATITQSRELGAFGTTNVTLNCNACVITGNAAGGVLLRQSSSARFTAGFTIADNGGPGVALSELSSALLQAGTATGNTGGVDVLCGPQFTSARGASNIGGGTTNCVEPSP